MDIRGQTAKVRANREKALFSHIFNTLVGIDENNEYYPVLATKWEQPDPQTWVFDLVDTATVASNTVARTDFTILIYFTLLALFFAYCYPISRLTRYLERRHAWLLQEARPPLVTNSLQLVKSLVRQGSHIAVTSELDVGPEILAASVVFVPLLKIGIYTAVFSQLALLPDTGFWTTLPGWLLALLFYDFLYYWNHRLGHTVGVFWAAHVVHHQSQDYNLSTALRQTSSGALLGWVFYLPMAVAGVPPLVFGIVALIDLLYQFWVHTEQVKKLGWFDRWFCSPSNHRVHHAVNERYLDRNYGGILIVWDRLFGSFKEEDERCVYGTRSPLASWDPLWANAEVYWGLLKDSWRAASWADKLRVWFKPPGWRPADVAARFPAPAFDIAQVQRYAPPMGRGVQWFAGLQFIALLAGVAGFLWFADGWPLARSAVVFAVLLTRSVSIVRTKALTPPS